jgi:hypothetical protein
LNAVWKVLAVNDKVGCANVRFSHGRDVGVELFGGDSLHMVSS